MKKSRKKWVALFVAFAVAFASAVLVPNGQAEAAKAKKPSFEKSRYLLFYSEPHKDRSFNNWFGLKNTAENAVVSEVRVTNNLLRIDGLPDRSGIRFYTTGTGSGTVSCKVRQGGKTYTVKCRVTVKKADPFKYVKIDGKKVYDKGKNNLCNYITAKKTAKISFKLNKGWKVKQLYTNEHDGNAGTMSEKKAFQNGKKVAVRQEKGCYTSVKLDVVNKKGEVYRYLICLRPKEDSSD